MPSVNIGVIQQFAHPPLALLGRETIPGLLTGSGTLTRPSGPIGVDAFGLIWSFFTVPSGYGYAYGPTLEYVERMVQWSVEYTLIDGHSFTLEYYDAHSDALPFLWVEPFPTSVLYDIAPGVGIAASWLLLL